MVNTHIHVSSIQYGVNGVLYNANLSYSIASAAAYQALTHSVGYIFDTWDTRCSTE